MPKLEWGLPGTSLYESGVDRGVLFVNGGNGVVWNGLTNVDLRTEGGEVQPYYVDGFRYLNVAQSSEFAATVTSYQTPSEFDVCVGKRSISQGLYATSQWPTRFDLSYRTMIGIDGDPDAGYKIHLVYNALAKKADVSHATRTEAIEPLTESFDIATTPVKIPGHKPTSHLVIDSREANPFVLGYLESILYGNNESLARMPTIEEVLNLFSWDAPDIQFPIHILGEGEPNFSTVSNLFTNPSFEAGSGTVEVRRNLFTNPSFEAGDEPMEIGRNLFTNPAVTSTAGFSKAAGHAGTMTYAGGAVRWTAGSESWLECRINLPLVPVGESHRLLVRARANRPINTYLRIQNSSDTPVITITEEWQWFETIYAPTSATGTSGPIFRPGDGHVVGDWIEIDRVLFTFGESDVLWFSGSSSPEPFMTASWTGAANASESILTIAFPQSPTGGYVFGACAPFLTVGEGVLSGTKALRIIPTGTAGTTSSYYQISGYNLALFKAGKTYTALASVTLPAPLSGPLNANALSLNALDSINPGSNVSAVAPNTAGTHHLRVTFTVPSDATWACLRLWNGAAAAGGDVIWDNVAIVEGVYDGPWFSGSAQPRVRENIFRNPSAVSTNRFESASGQATVSHTGAAVRWGIVTTQAVNIGMNAGNLPSTPHRILVRARANRNLAARLRVRAGQGPDLTLTPEWQWFEATLSGTGNANQTGLILLGDAGHVPGDWVEVDRVLVAVAGDEGEWFGGSAGAPQGFATAWTGSPNASPSFMYDADFSVAWTGAENASESVLTGVPVAGVAATRCLAIRSSKFGGSMRLIPTHGSIADSFAQFTVPASARSSGTALGTVHLESPLSGGVTDGRRLSIAAYNPAHRTPSAPNAAGSTPHRLTYSGLTDTFAVRFYHGGLQGSGDVYWAMGGLFQGVYDGPWFSGDSDPILFENQSIKPAWRAAENASPSDLIYSDFLLDKTGEPGDTYILDDELWTWHLHGHWFKSGNVPQTP